jgi:hypothetical protein
LTQIPTALLNHLMLGNCLLALLLIGGGLACFALLHHWSRRAKQPVDGYAQYFRVPEQPPAGRSVNINIVIK